MTTLQLGDITVQRIVEHEIPVYHPSEFFDEATAEAVERRMVMLRVKRKNEFRIEPRDFSRFSGQDQA